MTQFLGNFWVTLGLVLAALFLFGLGYAALVRWLAAKGVQGQTAYVVVVGVAVTVVFSGALTGWLNALIVLGCFCASGFWMVLEYIQRVHKEQQRDQMNATQIAKDILDDHPA